MRRPLCLQALCALLFSTRVLPAQTLLTAGDNRVSLAQVLRLHPEGMVLSLPGAQGQSLGAVLESALALEPAVELQLTSQELDPGLRAGQEFQRLQGWNSEKPHWALVGPDQRIYAEGSEPPSPTALAEAYRKCGLHTRVEILRNFFRENRDHTDALARLILETRILAEQRTEKALASKPAPDAGKEAPAPDPKNPQPSLLSEEEDARIWGEYASLYERFLSGGGWLDAAPDGSGPLPLAGQLSAMAEHSPMLRDLALRFMPSVEEHLRNRPGDERRWQVWMSLRSAVGPGRPSQVLEGLEPLPGALRWPPAAALDAFVEDARHRGDWSEAEPVLQAAFDQNLELLRAMESAAREDAGQRQGGSAAGVKVQMGDYFGFAGWSSDFAALLEAKLRLGKSQEAEQVFQEIYGRVPKNVIAQNAARLARELGVDYLAEKWGRLVR